MAGEVLTLPSNWSSTISPELDLQEDLIRLNVVYTTCEGLVALGAVVGNGLVIAAFHTERRLKRRTNYYIVSLATADFFVGLLGIPFAILASVGLPQQKHACHFTVSLLVMLCTISIFSLVAVSVDRYWAIIYPMGYSRNVRTKTAIGIIVVCWVAGCLVGLLPLLGWSHWNDQEPRCLFVEVMDYSYLVFLYFATIICPALLLLASYSHIFLVVRKQIRQMASLHPAPRATIKLRVLGAAQRREVKAARNLAIIVMFFIICWIPLYTINCIKAFCPECEPPLPLTNFCIILSHLNSAGNPLLYAYHLRDFRAALRNLLCPCTRALHVPTPGDTTYVPSTHRVHQIKTVTQGPERQSWSPPAIRRRSLSLGDQPMGKDNTLLTLDTSSNPRFILDPPLLTPECRSESDTWPKLPPPKVLGRSLSVQDVTMKSSRRSGLANSGYEATDTAALLFCSLPPLETELAFQAVTRPSSEASSASHEALVGKQDSTLVCITASRTRGSSVEAERMA